MRFWLLEFVSRGTNLIADPCAREAILREGSERVRPDVFFLRAHRGLLLR